MKTLYEETLTIFSLHNVYSYYLIKFKTAQVGTLDYNLYSTDYKEDVVAAAVYNVNTDEPSYYGYDTRFTGPQYFNGTDVFRYSDHDPIFLVLNIGSVDERPTATERSALSAVTRTVERQLGRVARALVRAP